MAPQWLPSRGGRGVHRRHRDGDGGISAEPCFVRRAVQLNEATVDGRLVRDGHPTQRDRNLRGNVTDGPIDAKPAERPAAIAKIDRFVRAG